ncbi:MAG: GTP-binding protein, partial [Planctomycetota bacterium]
MPTYQTQDIRNIALVGHTGAGKTSLVEALLHHAGAIGSPGSVERGNTLCDFEPEEKEHQHSIASAIVSCDVQGSHINLIDTPGSPDFMGQSISVLPAVETVAVVVNASAGIEMTTRRMMDRARENNLCRMIIVNKIDGEDVDLPGLVERLREAFGTECLPINLPSGATVADVFDHDSGD